MGDRVQAFYAGLDCELSGVGDCMHGVTVEAKLLVSVLVAHLVFICFDRCFCEYQDHTDSPAIPVGACRVM